MAIIEEYDAGDLHIQIHAHDSDFTNHPGVRIEVPGNFKVLGGGARVNWQGAGNLLTGMFPDTDRVWAVSSKDHDIASPATVTAFCICACMRDGSMISNDDYIIKFEDSHRDNHPSHETVLPGGFILVGGGARANNGGAGSLLFASHPGGWNSWVAASKDHKIPDVATITTYAIGLKTSFLQRIGLGVVRAQPQTGAPDNHPNVTAALPQGFRLFCGGARANWKGAGSLLTASYPQDRHTWIVKSKDHEIADPSTVTAFGVGVSI